MSADISFETISANQIIYDYDTKLFPFSPRLAIDKRLIERLKNSLIETGFWEPIVVRADTLEGIAGNHRFLAYLAWGDARNIPSDQLKIPVALINCDEATALHIALIENDVRQNLSQMETIRALIQGFKRKPSITQRVFQVDDYVIQQLSLWQDDMPVQEPIPSTGKLPLTREWLSVVKTRLENYPQLRQQFLSKLKDYHWVNGHSLRTLNDAITEAIQQQSQKFVSDKTWLSTPTSKCLGQLQWEAVYTGISTQSSDVVLDEFGVCQAFCPHLHLFPEFLTEFIPSASGTAFISVQRDSVDPSDVLTTDAHRVRGEYRSRLSTIHAFCADPDNNRVDSCFHQQETQKKLTLIEQLKDKNLPAVLPKFVRDRKHTGDFVWKLPQRDGNACTPKTCLHGDDIPPGFVAMITSEGGWQMVCIHSECGSLGQEQLRDIQATQRRETHRQYLRALNRLKRHTAEQVLLSPHPTPLTQSETLSALEKLLVPEWDFKSMEYILTGWQQFTRYRIAAELGVAQPEDKSITRIFRERFPELSQKITLNSPNELFVRLRTLLVPKMISQEQWVWLLIEARNVRDAVGESKDISRINAYLDGN